MQKTNAAAPPFKKLVTHFLHASIHADTFLVAFGTALEKTDCAKEGAGRLRAGGGRKNARHGANNDTPQQHSDRRQYHGATDRNVTA